MVYIFLVSVTGSEYFTSIMPRVSTRGKNTRVISTLPWYTCGPPYVYMHYLYSCHQWQPSSHLLVVNFPEFLAEDFAAIGWFLFYFELVRASSCHEQVTRMLEQSVISLESVFVAEVFLEVVVSLSVPIPVLVLVLGSSAWDNLLLWMCVRRLYPVAVRSQENLF